MAIDTVTESAKDSRARPSRSSNPADGSVIANVPLDGPAEVAATVARVRANQPAWEELGIKGRAQWLYKLRDWMLDHQDEIADTMQRGDRQGPRRGRGRGRLPRRPDQLLRQEGRQVHRRREGRRPLAADEGEEAQGPVPALSGRRRDQPLELPADPLARRRDPRADRGLPRSSSSPPRSPRSASTEIVEAWKSEIGGPDVFDVVNGMGETGSALVDEVDFVQFTGSDRTGQEGPGAGGRDPDPGQRRARRQGPDDRPARAPTSRGPPTPPTWGAFANSARSASRSSASTSRSRSTTSS